MVVEVEGATVEVDGADRFDIGRGPECAVRVDHALVSRRHLSVATAGGSWVVEDCGSSNGTFKDGRRVGRLIVTRPVTLRLGHPADGAEVRLAPPSAGVTMHTLSSRVRIGRDADNDIVLDDLLVSRHHAELVVDASGATEIVDLGSHNGTQVNGRRAARALVGPADVVSIGRHRLRLTADGVEEYVDGGAVAFAAVDLTVTTGDGRRLLDGVGFRLEACSFLAVVGPSGAGKSTLLGALTGRHPATSGAVRYDGRDLYAEYDSLRTRIGLVPQDDIVHGDLTVDDALGFAAELRFSPDVTDADRRGRIDAVLDELGLLTRRDQRISSLSGGQRKRVSVAIELLTRPSLLFLDEPTSGLDPGYERTLMTQLRALADGGRTVVVVTHSVASIGLCDRVLCLAPGGGVAYFGPPEGITAYFGVPDVEEVFRLLSADDGTDWAARFATSRPAAEPLVETEHSHDRASGHDPVGVRRSAGSWLRQLSMLSRRHVALLRADGRNLAMVAGAAPVLGVLMLVALPEGELGPLPSTQIRLVSQASVVLFVLVIGMTQLGASTSVQEIVRESAILRRERAAGLSLSAYVVSKALVLGAVVTIQALVLALIATARQNGPIDAVLLGSPRLELAVVVAVAGLASMALGLLVSASASTPARAMTVLPVLVIVQVVLASGGVFPSVADRPGLRQAQYLSTAQWGFSAAASTAQLNDLQAVNNIARELPVIDVTDPGRVIDVLADDHRGEPRWNHARSAWIGAVAVNLAMTVALLVATGLVLRARDPDRAAGRDRRS